MNISWSDSELETITKFIQQIRSYIDTYRHNDEQYSAYDLVTELEQLRHVNYNTNNIGLPINVYHHLNGGYYYDDDIMNDIEDIDIHKLSAKEIEQLQNDNYIVSNIHYCSNFNVYHGHLTNDNFELVSTFSRLQDNITNANLHDVAIPANTFANILSNNVITKIVLSNVTSRITTFADVATYSELIHVEFVNFNTPRLKSCAHMFSNSHNLRYVNITGWNAPNLLDASYMFAECNQLRQIIGSNNFIKSRVRTLEGMLLECEELQTFDVTGWDISNVTNMNNMFCDCINLLHIRGLEHLNLFSIIYMRMMLYGCDRLNNITITFGDDTDVDKEKITSMFGNNDNGCDLYAVVNTKCEKFAIGLS